MGLWLKYTSFTLVYIPHCYVCTRCGKNGNELGLEGRLPKQLTYCMTKKIRKTTGDLYASSFVLVSDTLLVTAMSMSWRQH